jgi:hypothetical protein
MTIGINDLTLERHDQEDKTVIIGGGIGMMTPAIDENYWEYRVRVSETQSVVGFPKFGTIGIGFAVEEDWNTNLPYQAETKDIRQHIWHNRGDDSITEDIVDRAIEMIREAATQDRG